MDPAAPYHTLVEALVGVVISGCGWYLYKLSKRVDEIEEDVRKYEGDVGVGHNKLENLTAMIQGHMDREEGKLADLETLYRDLLVQLSVLVTKLDVMSNAASTEYARIANNEKEAEDWKQRIVRIETRLEKVESGYATKASH